MKKLTEQDRKDIHLKYVINKALGKYESYWGYREDKQSNIVEEVFKEIREDGKLL
tara:strand:+ start:514 stop:678 length:165 start_codon:yes stop_codon:yes gene_type:complete